MISSDIRKKTRVKLSHCIIVSLVFMAIALMYVWFHVKITRLNYAIADEIAVRNKLTEENRRLKVERAALKSSHRIEEVAKTQLGMYYPDKDQVVFVR
jgi:cell division protein FtsL